MKDDEGLYLLDNLLILAPFHSEQDIEDGRTSLSIDTEYGTLPENDGFFGASKYLLYTIPEVSHAIIETAPVVIQATYEIDILEYHKGNNVGITDAHLATACYTSIENCNSAYAQAIDEKTKKPRLVTYRLKIPHDPVTGEQIYVHSNCWQGESWSSRHDASSGELKVSANIAVFEQPSKALTSVTYEKVIGMLTYRVAIVGNEHKDLHRMTTSSPVRKKVVDRLQASRSAKASQDQAKASNRGAPPSTSNRGPPPSTSRRGPPPGYSPPPQFTPPFNTAPGHTHYTTPTFNAGHTLYTTPPGQRQLNTQPNQGTTRPNQDPPFNTEEYDGNNDSDLDGNESVVQVSMASHSQEEESKTEQQGEWEQYVEGSTDVDRKQVYYDDHGQGWVKRG